jgi:hypothetical protein
LAAGFLYISLSINKFCGYNQPIFTLDNISALSYWHWSLDYDFITIYSQIFTSHAIAAYKRIAKTGIGPKCIPGIIVL